MNQNFANSRALQQPSPKGPGKALRYALGALIPAVIGVYWPLYWGHPQKTVVVLRPAILIVAALATIMYGRYRVSRAETRFAQVLGVFCTLWLGTSLGASDVGLALQDWIKLCAICFIAVLAARFLRNKDVCKGFGYSLIGASVVIGTFVIYSHVRFRGLVLPTYESARRFKALAEHLGIPLNPIAFTGVFSYILGMCLVKPKRWLWLVGAMLFVVISIFTGSRAPLAVLVLSASCLLILNGLRTRHTAVRFASWVALVASLIGVPLLMSSISFKTMTEVTEGRWDLWYVAIHKFWQSPLIGNGYESVHDDLVSLLPGVYKFKTSDEVLGGYHNEYLTVLAEQGLIGFAAVIVLGWFLVRRSWQTAFCRWCTWQNGQWLLFVVVFLLIRALIEVPGLFGYAREPVDFLAFLAAGLLVSRFSIEEDSARRFKRSYAAELAQAAESGTLAA